MLNGYYGRQQRMPTCRLNEKQEKGRNEDIKKRLKLRCLFY